MGYSSLHSCTSNTTDVRVCFMLLCMYVYIKYGSVHTSVEQYRIYSFM